MRKGLIGSGDRSDRIRTYNFPQGRLTDHRINLTLYKLLAIMEGDLGDVLEALRARARPSSWPSWNRACRRERHDADLATPTNRPMTAIQTIASGKPRHRGAGAAASRVERLDAQLLLLHALGRDADDRAWLLAHDTDACPQAAWAALADQLSRRLAGRAGGLSAGREEIPRPRACRSMPACWCRGPTPKP